MSQPAWRITLRQGKQVRRYVVTQTIDVGDVCNIQGEKGPWAVVKKEPTEILLNINLCPAKCGWPGKAKGPQ